MYPDSTQILAPFREPSRSACSHAPMMRFVGGVIVPWPTVAKALNQATVNVHPGARPGLPGNMSPRRSAGQRRERREEPDTRLAAKEDVSEQALRLTLKSMQLLNIGSEWLRTYLPHTLQKIDRVSFGLLSQEEYNRLAVSERHSMRKPLSGEEACR